MTNKTNTTTKKTNASYKAAEQTFKASRPSVKARDALEAARVAVDDKKSKLNPWTLLAVSWALVIGTGFGWFLCTVAQVDANQHALTIDQVKEFQK